jgi:hypothetical protein
MARLACSDSPFLLLLYKLWSRIWTLWIESAEHGGPSVCSNLVSSEQDRKCNRPWRPMGLWAVEDPMNIKFHFQLATLSCDCRCMFNKSYIYFTQQDAPHKNKINFSFHFSMTWHLDQDSPLLVKLKAKLEIRKVGMFSLGRLLLSWIKYNKTPIPHLQLNLTCICCTRFFTCFGFNKPSSGVSHI